MIKGKDVRTGRGNSRKKKNGFRPKKSLGQHFLRDQAIIRGIIDRAGLVKSDRVMEIGSGLGALTFPLARAVRQVLAIEKDSRLTDILSERLSRAGIRNVTLVNDDILKFDFSRLATFSPDKIKVIGNLPYNISSPLLEKLISNRGLITRAVLMLQHELAARLVASPGSRAYGSITVLSQYYARLSPLLEASKEAFSPVPRVGSMVLEFDFDTPHPRKAEDEANFKMIVKGAFAHKRKTLLNSLKRKLPPYSMEEILKAMEQCGISPGVRAEALGIDDFLCLSSELFSIS